MTPTDANTAAVETSSTAPAAEVEQSIPAAGPERIEWQRTGKYTPKADSTTAPEGEQSSKSAPASEAGKPQEKKSPAAERLDEVLADLKAAGLSPAELKTFRKEAAKSTQAESSPAQTPIEVKAPAPKALEAPKEPDMTDQKYQVDGGWDIYTADVVQFNKDNAKYEAALAVENYKREQTQKQQSEVIAKEFAAAEKKYPDFNEKSGPLLNTLLTDKSIHPVVPEVVGNSPLFTDVLYVLGGEMADFLQLAKTDPLRAVKKVGVIEHLIAEELAKSPAAEAQRNEKGQFTPEKKSKAVSDAPAPPVEVGGKGTPPADEVDAALESGDTRAYIDAQNRRDLASRKR